MLKIRANQRVINKSLYLALGINMEGHKELLGLWLAETEGAKFWLSVPEEPRSGRHPERVCGRSQGLP